MELVYVVTSGSYSDYRIRGIYSTEEMAEKYKRAIGYDANDVEIWEVDKIYSQIERGYLYWAVNFDKDGNVKRIRISDAIEDDYYHYINGPTEGIKKNSVTYYNPDYKNPFSFGDECLESGHMNVYIWAKSEEQAVKIASEIRAQVLADEVFINSVKASGNYTAHLDLGNLGESEANIAE